MEYTKDLQTSPMLRTWGGLFALSAAATRRVFLRTNEAMKELYPNLYVMLVAPPGVGKDQIVDKVVDTLMSVAEEAEDGYGVNLAEESISAKGLVDALASEDSVLKLVRETRQGKKLEFFHSLTICVPELGTMLPDYNPSLVSNFNELYNCRRHFRDRVRGGATRGQATVITNPHLAMLTGTQPETLVKIFPEEAFKMGFFSRTMLIFEPTLDRKPLYNVKLTPVGHLQQQLVDHLLKVSKLTGQFQVTKPYADMADDFHLTGCDKTALLHSRFFDYNTRRSLHVQKIAMCLALAEDKPELVLDTRHFLAALELLLDAESRMANIFKNLISSRGFQNSVEEVLMLALDNGTVNEYTIRRMLRRTHPPHEVRTIIEEIIASKDLVVLHVAEDGHRTFAHPASSQARLRAVK